MKRLLPLLPDLLGLGGYALVCAGVGLLWGRAWVFIAVGAPPAAAYAWREIRALSPRRRS